MRHRFVRRFGLDPALPGQVRRANQAAVLAWIAAFLVLVPMLILDSTVITGTIPARWYILVNVAMLLVILSRKRFARRITRRAAARDHLLCPDCTYDLRTLDAAGTCRECGRAYEHEAVRAQWVDAPRRLKRK